MTLLFLVQFEYNGPTFYLTSSELLLFFPSSFAKNKVEYGELNLIQHMSAHNYYFLCFSINLCNSSFFTPTTLSATLPFLISMKVGIVCT